MTAIWVQNLAAFYGLAETREEQLATLVMLTGSGHRWLDRIDVVGHPEHEQSARDALAIFDDFCAWVRLREPLGALTETWLLTRRLRGLTKAEGES